MADPTFENRRWPIKRGNLADVRKQIDNNLFDIEEILDRIVEYLGALPPGGGIVLGYQWDTALTGDPGDGFLGADNADYFLVTTLRISKLNSNGSNAGLILQELNQGDLIGYFEIPAPNGTSLFGVTGAPIDQGTYFEIPVELSTNPDNALPSAQGNETDLYIIGNPKRLIPDGGNTRDFLEKQSTDDYDVAWVDPLTRFAPFDIEHADLPDIGPDDHHNQQHLLYGPDHTDVTTISGPMLIRQLLAWRENDDFFAPETRMNWRGVWVPDTYHIHDVVLDNPYTMVANKTTQDRAAPTDLGSPFWTLPDAPVWQTAQQDAVVYSGHQYIFNETMEFRGLRIWVPTLSPDTYYRVVYIVDPNGANPVVGTIEEPVLTAGEWTLLGLNTSLLTAGTELLVYLDSLNSGSSTGVSGGWRYDGADNNIDPANQGWNRNTQHTLLRMSVNDLDSVGRELELLGITTGSTVQFVQTDNPDNSVTYRVSADPTSDGTTVDFSVVLIDQGINTPAVGLPTTMTADIPVSQPTDFVTVLDGWLGNQPQGITVQSFLQYDGVTQPVSPDNQYGVDILVQRLSISPDWDLVASFGGSSGGGSGTPFPEAPADGQAYGRDGQDADWDAVYRKTEADAAFEPLGKIREWRESNINETLAWKDSVLVQGVGLTYTLPAATIADQPQDIRIVNNNRNVTHGQDAVITIQPAASHFFIFDGRETAFNESVTINPGEGLRLVVYADDIYYAIIDSAGRFDGAGTSGFVPDPETESGRVLTDGGTWVPIIVPPVGGLQIEFDFNNSTAGGDPGAGKVACNNVDPLLATEIQISKTTKNGNVLEFLWDSVQQGDFIFYIDELNGITYAWKLGDTTGSDMGTYHVYVPVDADAQGGTLANNAALNVAVVGNPQSRVPPGGLENEVLAKSSSNDFETEWQPRPDFDSIWWEDVGGNAIANKNGGNVGIGTSNPQLLFHIHKDAGTKMLFTSATSGEVGGTDGTEVGLSDVSDDFLIWNRETQAVRIATSNVERMRIDSAGNVGIGTTNPLNPLHIKASASHVFRIESTDASPYMSFYPDGGAARKGYIQSASAADYLLVHSEMDALRLQANNNVIIRTDSVSRMQVNSVGDVSIGGIAPLYRFHVRSGVTNDEPAAVFESVGGRGLEFEPFVTGGSNGAGWRLNTQNATRGEIQLSVATRLMYTTRFQSGSTSYHIWYTGTSSTTEKMRLINSGSLLLNTAALSGAAPANTKLEVNGNVNLTSGNNYYINGVPISTFIDAPSDGDIYGRKDAGWVSLGTGTGTVSNLSIINLGASSFGIGNSGGDNIASFPMASGSLAGAITSTNFNDWEGKLSSVDLSFTRTATTVTVTNTGGTDAVLPAATTTNAGVMSAVDKAILDSVNQQGVWTPRYETPAGGTAGTVAYTWQNGTWVRFGQYITVNFEMKISNSTSTATSEVAIGDLPFPADMDGNHAYVGVIGHIIDWDLPLNSFNISLIIDEDGSDQMRIAISFDKDNQGGPGVANFATWDMISAGNDPFIQGQITYKTASL